MAIFKFRIIAKNEDDFFRDIVIHSEKTFLDFHEIIVKSIEPLTNDNSSFYLCDEKWHKISQIAVKEMLPDNNIQPELKNENRLIDFVRFPNQKLIYIYHKHNITFYIRLNEILSLCQDNAETRCVSSKGHIHLSNKAIC